jgi:hypothetical protein
MREIGLRTPLKVMFEKLLEGHNPIISSNKAIYVLTADYYDDGKFAYTKFVDDEAVYSVMCYFSFKDSVESILKKAENGYYGFIDPLIDEIPEVDEPPTSNPPECGC